MTQPRRLRRLALPVLVVQMLVLALGAMAPAGAGAIHDDRLPDLRMLTPREFHTQTYAGQRRLRFSTIMVNVGQGPFEVRGRRSSTSSSLMSIRQRIYTDSGIRDRLTDAVMKYTGDGHDHWHVQRIARYELLRPGNKPLPSAKIGFCFFDTTAYDRTLPRAPWYRQYVESTCGTRYSSGAQMGLSVGWGDEYPWDFVFQWIDITGLTPGIYRICATADGPNWFRELSDTNNQSWADVRITSTGATLLAKARSTCGDRATTRG